MANPEHLRILKQGVEVWNRWRLSETAYGIVPDLNNADLSGADLGEANLNTANLRRSDLSGANLSSALFFSADLSGANLKGAKLHRTHLLDAFLTGANLEGTFLYMTNLLGANLSNANLAGAILFETNFANTNLSGAYGLEECEHTGPSILDLRTLKKSWPLPLSFLQGCGLSDADIEYVKLYRKDLSESQITDITYRIHELRSSGAIQFYSCFISYSSKNEDVARQLHDDLQKAGVRCWFAPEKLKIGDEFRDVIDRAVHLHDRLLLILSKDSVKSEWVKDEVETALAKERKQKPKQTVLFPIRIDDAIQRTRQAWASKLRHQRHIGDFRQWTDPDKYDAAFQRLLRDLHASA